MREYGVVRWNLGATKEEVEASKPYLGQARVQLGIMKNLMALGNQQQGTRAVTLPDGTVIRSQSVMGQDTVQITPTVAAVAAVAARAAQPVAAEDNPRVRVAGVVGGFAAYWDYPSNTVVVSGIAASSPIFMRMSHNARYITIDPFVWDTHTGDVINSGLRTVVAVTDYGAAAGIVDVGMGVEYGFSSETHSGVETYHDATTGSAISEAEFYARVAAVENSPFAAGHFVLTTRSESTNLLFEHYRAFQNWSRPGYSLVETVALGSSFGAIRGAGRLVSRTGDVQVHIRTAAYVQFSNVYSGELDRGGLGDPADIVPLTAHDAAARARVFVTGVGIIEDSRYDVALSANGRFAVVATQTFSPQVDYYDHSYISDLGYFTGTITSIGGAGTYGVLQYRIFNTDTGGNDVLFNDGPDSEVTCVDDAGRCYGHDSAGRAVKVFADGTQIISGLFWPTGVTHDGLAVLGSLWDGSPAIFIEGHTVGLPAGFSAWKSVASF